MSPISQIGVLNELTSYNPP